MRKFKRLVIKIRNVENHELSGEMRDIAKSATGESEWSSSTWWRRGCGGGDPRRSIWELLAKCGCSSRQQGACIRPDTAE
jgi:hypothetical protein